MMHSSGPFRPFLLSAIAIIAWLTLSRFALTIMSWESIRGLGDVATIMIQGWRVDLMSVSRLYFLPLIMFVVSRWLPIAARKPIDIFCFVWMTVVSVGFVFFEVITPTYIWEYGTRPERKFFEYLTSPKETMEMLWLSFRWQVVTSLAVVGTSIWVLSRWHFRLVTSSPSWSLGRIAVALPIVLMVMFIAGRGTIEGKPLHPGQVAFANNILLNNLPLNSFFSASYAAYRIAEEVNPSDLYGSMPDDVVREIVRDITEPKANYAHSIELPANPKNIVIILEESLGARYVKSLGGQALTPNLERLSADGWWFENMYATGTRSVRGIEAVLAGFLPTPGRSVVRLADSQTKVFTLAALLSAAGYQSGFYYGGRSDFDNMRGFTLSNGFDYVFDEEDLKHGSFRSTYGYSDDDVFNAIHDKLASSETKPKFILTLTTSNHQPFEIPVDASTVETEPALGRMNAVRYADAALGRFIDKARSSNYWQDTIFLIVADHDAKVADFWSKYQAPAQKDKDLIFPIEGFHVPALFLGPSVPKKRSKFIASQIDLPTTILGLAHIRAPHPMIGKDLSMVSPDYKGRAIMQFDQYHAHLTAKEIIVFRPNKSISFGTIGSGNTISQNPFGVDASTQKVALAQSIWPRVVYLSNEYYVDYKNVLVGQRQMPQVAFEVSSRENLH
jgi:phosphoglycerol transferase MdoB-like AlkP superfamily enzyme